MAAAPWLAKVLEVAPETVLSDFYKAAKLLMQNHSNKYERPLDCIDEALMKRGDKELFGDVKSLDGDIFFEVALDNKNRHENQDQAQIVKKALSALRNATNQQLEANNQSKLEPVSPFYAVLMMDGDSLGSQMSDTDKQTAISESLNHFTQGVKNKVEEHSGFLIYAGGDDVLALLPLEFALACAYDLRKLYLESFEKKGSYTKTDGTKGKVKSTLSGAIEYAHIKMPLGKVLGDAHHLLDEVAKDDCGRDSIAVRVWKPNGQHLQWAMPWKYATDNNKVIIDDIVEKYREVNKETPFSNSFFFNIEQRFAMLQNKNKSGEQELATDMEISTIVKLIAAEYLNSGVNDKREKDKKITLLQAEAQIRPLIEQCMPVKRKFKDGEESFDELKQLNIDAAHFIRFLVSKGVERG
jgi:CRISPR-associated protein Cmr2